MDPKLRDARTLTERERETLQLLLVGHDAKSIAHHLELSVHTINERLRNARRKLGVSSSREAARLLAEAERRTPDTLGDKPLGVAVNGGGVPSSGQVRPARGAHRLAWFGGGMVVMSLVIAAVALSSALPPRAVPGTPATAPAAPSGDPAAAASLVRARLAGPA